jgi:hypothetical protein
MADNLTDGIPEITLQMEANSVVQSPVDPTLSISGQAADAKATGDAIAAINAEITDILDLLFPVGAIYVSVTSTAPEFIGDATWVEIKIPATWGDIEDGNRSFVDGTGTGTIHIWRRTA